MLSEAQFHGFLEENPDAVIIIDQNGLINFASHRVETMFGHLPHELVGKPVSILIPEKHRDLHAVHMERFMEESHTTHDNKRRDHCDPEHQAEVIPADQHQPDRNERSKNKSRRIESEPQPER